MVALGSDNLIFYAENVNQIVCLFQISISATRVKLKIQSQNIRGPYQFSKYAKMVLPRNMFLMLARFLAIQLNIAQQQLQILTLLCYRRGHLLTIEVLLMLQMNHRNALRHRRRFHPYWMLPRPAESWLEIHFNRRIIPETFFSSTENETKYIRSPLGNLTSFFSKGRYKI